MDVHHDLVAHRGHAPHGLREAVAGRGLHHVLHQLPAVGLCLSPLLGDLVGAHVDDALAAALGRVLLQPGAPVDEPPAGREHHDQVPIPVVKDHAGAFADAVRPHRAAGHVLPFSDIVRGDTDAPADRAALPDRGLRRGFVVIPELDDVGVRGPPLVDHALQLLLRDGSAAVHRLHGADAALVSAGQHSDLALLAEVLVHAVLLDRHVVHHRRCLAVDVLACLEGVQRPLLAREPCDHAGLDG